MIDIDIEKLKRDWRQLAASHGLDPEYGFALDWWQDPEIWDDQGYCRSEVEEVALRRLFVQCCYISLRQFIEQAQRARDHGRFVALREVHAARGERLTFVESESEIGYMQVLMKTT